MRLRAEYLYAIGQLNEIRFIDNNNRVYTPGKIENADQWQQFLEKVFVHCGTLSLQSQLHKLAKEKDIRMGDVLIQGGSPGHAMLIVDIVENNNGQKLFLLAQSYMPAQDIHIVMNPAETDLSPWFLSKEGAVLTPEWAFKPGCWMRW